jgi:hypothetical protein
MLLAKLRIQWKVLCEEFGFTVFVDEFAEES